MPDDGLPDLTERLRVRRRASRGRRWVPTGIALAILVLSLVAQWLVKDGPLLRLTRVEANATSLLSAQQVRDAADLPLGEPLARVDLDAAARRVAALGAVDHVVVQRKWPHTVEVQVTGRTAAYQRRTTKGYQWVDSHGIVFRTLADPTRGLVTVTTTGVANNMLAGVAQTLDALTPTVKAKVLSVDATTPDNIVLRLQGGRRVTWGGADESDLKARVLQVLLGQPVKTIDVSSPTHPTGR